MIKTRREAALRPAMIRIVDQRTVMSGTIEFPALPGLADHIVQRTVDLLAAFGRGFSRPETDTLRALIVRALAEGYQKSSDARVVVELTAPPGKGVNYKIGVRHLTLEERYETLASLRPPPLFGKVPDAMVMDTARKLAEAGPLRVLDVGAGTGRNAVALARFGHSVTAVEPVAKFAEELRSRAREASLPMRSSSRTSWPRTCPSTNVAISSS